MFSVLWVGESVWAPPWTPDLATPEGRTTMLLSFYFRHPQVFESEWTFQRNLLELTEDIADAYDLIDPDKRASLQISDKTTFLISYANGDQFDENTDAINILKAQLLSKLQKFNIPSHMSMSDWTQTLTKDTKTLANAYVLLPLVFDVDGQQRSQPQEYIQGLTRDTIENTYSDSLPQHYQNPFMTALKQSQEEFKPVINKVQNDFKSKFLNPAIQVTKSGQSRKKEALSIEKMPAAFSAFRCFGGDCPVQSVPFHGLEKDASVYLIRKNDRIDSQPEAYAFVKNVGGIPYIITINGKLNSSQASQTVRLIAHDFETEQYYISKDPKGFALVNTDAMEKGLKQGALQEQKTINLGSGWETIDQATEDLNMTGYKNYYSASLLQEVEKRSIVPKSPEETIQRKTRSSPSYLQQKSLKHRPLKERALLAVRLWSQREKDLEPFLKSNQLSQKQFDAAQNLTDLKDNFFLMPNDFLALKKHLNYEIKDLDNLPLLNRIPSYWHIWELLTESDKQWLKEQLPKLKNQLEREMTHQGIELTEKRSQLLNIAQISMEVIERLISDQKISKDFLNSLEPLLNKVDIPTAAEYKAKGVLEILLKQNGADPNVKAPLYLAASQGHTDIVALLLKHGADPNVESESGLKPLQLAAPQGHTDIVALLLNHGADPNVKNNHNKTPLHWATQQGHTDIVALLLKHGADPNAKDKEESTPLHLKTLAGHTDIVAFLLNHGADPNVKNKEGNTLLHFETLAGHTDIVALLLNHGADPNVKNKEGNTPLHWAAWNDCNDTMTLLLNHGADPNVKNKEGATPLHWAAWDDYNDTMTLLLNHGADPNVKNKERATPLHFETLKSHTDTVIFLENHHTTKKNSKPYISPSCWSWLLKIHRPPLK